MLADDMGMGDTSAYQDLTGNSDKVQIHTPNMERLAATGVRFADAHSPGTRCSPTRYSLLTGRYPWRSRLKWWVLFGAQGDPLIEPTRPTIGTLLQESGYRTGLVGKWHVGLRYRQSDGSPAAEWIDANLTQPLHSSPIDHGFDFARFTSRSHGTSGPSGTTKNPARANSPTQRVGPGHIHGRQLVSASGQGKALQSSGPNAYVLDKLGSRHSDHAIQFLQAHQSGGPFAKQAFFLYYPSNSNHSPYTPDLNIGGSQVLGGARTKSGEAMDARHDYIYENDVALGRLMDWLRQTADPRWPGHQLSENTLVIFSSDNGAEKNSNVATGPFRSNKGSCYEGGHRVPFIAAWPAGGIKATDSTSQTSSTPIGLQDLFATFSEIVKKPLPDLRERRRGAEDSISFLAALQGKAQKREAPLFFGDHKESPSDPAVLAMRLDHPRLDDRVIPGQWKIFFDASLIRFGQAKAFELYNLATDPTESSNLIAEPRFQPLVKHLSNIAHRHRRSAGHRFVPLSQANEIRFDLTPQSSQFRSLSARLKDSTHTDLKISSKPLTMAISSFSNAPFVAAKALTLKETGLGVRGSTTGRIEASNTLEVSFDQSVLVQSIGLLAGGGKCGGTVRLGSSAPLPIYCLDSDNDSKTQHGEMSDLGILERGEVITIDPTPYLGVESAGSWTLSHLSVRLLKDN